MSRCCGLCSLFSRLRCFTVPASWYAPFIGTAAVGLGSSAAGRGSRWTETPLYRPD
ncbi:hypothetical protein NEOLEDRAFT_1137532 [Neolentinus lepideus HHB14362 ss-1]|uniref:Uncharacterized protein n=1 Tax=Neolentinus lepideus HHB14362 ss-1 TaxID=1314782 RepID=A0A165QQP1_9AGAM|nr:hypothetical protein NEOLEDRAFT_1137532 [Neolentinus lepideus HHB14362 ss-1]